MDGEERKERHLRLVEDTEQAPASLDAHRTASLFELAELYVTLRGRLDQVSSQIEQRTGKYPEALLSDMKKLFAPVNGEDERGPA